MPKEVKVISQSPIPPENLINIEELARRLHQTEAWVREKCRRRCSNPIPVYNLGRHLLFCWSDVRVDSQLTTPYSRAAQPQEEAVRKEGGLAPPLLLSEPLIPRFDLFQCRAHPF